MSLLVDLSPQSATAPAGASHTFTATVRDASSGGPMAGQRVVFLRNGYSIHTGLTDANGQASVSYTHAWDWTDSIMAFVDLNADWIQGPGEPSANATMIWYEVALELSPANRAAPVGETHVASATARRSSNQAPVPGLKVVYAVNGAHPQGGSATTDANGQVSFSYLGTWAGQDSIHAFVDLDGSGMQHPHWPQASAVVDWSSVWPDLPAYPDAPVGTWQNVTVTVVTPGPTPVPVPGRTVVYSVSGAHVLSGTAVTDGSGEVSFSYIGMSDGLDSIQVYVDLDANGAYDSGYDRFNATLKRWNRVDLALSPAWVAVPIGTELTVTATARDSKSYSPVPGLTVDYTVGGAHPLSGTAVTDPGGEIRLSYTGTSVGTDTISAYVDLDTDGSQDPGEPSHTAMVTWNPIVVHVLSKPDVVVGMPDPVTVAVEDSVSQAPAQGVSVVYSVTGTHTLGGSLVTDSTGRATFSYSGANEGTDTVSVFVDLDTDGVQGSSEPSDSITKRWFRIALTLSPATATGPVGARHFVKASVVDASTGAPLPLPGTRVVLSVTGANTYGATLVADPAGHAEVFYIGMKAGTDSISAFVDLNANGIHDPGEPTAAVTRTWDPLTIGLSPSTESGPVGTPHAVMAIVMNATTAALVPDRTVRFSVSGAHSLTGVKTTDAGGQAGFSFIGTKAGTDVVAAFVDLDGLGIKNPWEPSATATMAWDGVTLDVSPVGDAALVGTRHTVTATARNVSTGSVVPGLQVIYRVSGVHTLQGMMVADPTGQAAFSYLGTISGKDTILAFLDLDVDGVQDPNDPSQTVSKMWEPVMLDLAPGSATDLVGRQHTVTAAVREDGTLDPVPGATVIFTVTGAHKKTGSIVSDANGEAVLIYRGATVGSDAISAFVDLDLDGGQDRGEPTGSAGMDWVGISLTLTPPAHLAPIGTQHVVMATVRALSTGAPVPGQAVGFSVIGVHPGFAGRVTNPAGQAFLMYVGSNVGVDTITAYADLNRNRQFDVGDPRDSATMTWTSG